ncbi:type VII secretion protein EccB [Nocardioides sp. GCM10027113]|uniref:type VII secretion protein EccB n=1 Tax=unclassified Nocardioides TaxID=2615069 RepID=UPI0036064F85
MATKKDLTEAYSFSRRRLVTAFVSGAPGGREVEPARPGRTVVGGLALSVLLLAGAAVAGVFKPSVDEDWAERPGLVVAEETGAAYVITAVEDGEEPVLRPVINITSAMLILGADTEPTIVPAEEISAERLGDDIGILGAPSTVPDPARLVDDGWTACVTDAGGLRVDVTAEPVHEPAPGGAMLVEVRGSDDDAVYVVAESGEEAEPRAYSYRLPAGSGRDNLLAAIGLDAADTAAPVPEEWLALFPPGGDLTSQPFELDQAETRPAYADALEGVGAPRIGDVLETDAGERLLLAEDGPVTLTDFAHGVYAGSADFTTHAVSSPPDVRRGERTYLAATWPRDRVTSVVGEQCALLEASADRRPAVRVVTRPADAPVPRSVPPGGRDVVVDEGAGAFVLTGGWDPLTDATATGAGGDPHLIDAKGTRYPIAGMGAAALLGFADHPAPHVPDSWLELFRPGVTLSQQAALCAPRLDPEAPCG